MPITKIYCHEYTIFKMHPESKMGVNQIVITMTTETEDNQHFEAVEQALKILDGSDINVSHRILLEGYRNDK